MHNFIIPTSDELIHATWYYDSSDVLLRQKTNPIAVVVHGLGGYKEEKMLQTVKDCFLKHNIWVLMFDARHALGETGGNLEKACFTGFIDDLNTVINWLKNNGCARNPLYLAGHSLGAGAVLHYATHYNNQIRGLITLSAVYNGNLLKESYLNNKPDFMQEWQEKKLIYRQHPKHPNRNGYISINHLEDACRYSLEKEVQKITCPVLIVCGDHDVSSTISINEKLYNSFNKNAFLQIVKNCGHTFSKEENLIELKNTVSAWLSTNLNSTKK